VAAVLAVAVASVGEPCGRWGEGGVAGGAFACPAVRRPARGSRWLGTVGRGSVMSSQRSPQYDDVSRFLLARLDEQSASGADVTAQRRVVEVCEMNVYLSEHAAAEDDRFLDGMAAGLESAVVHLAEAFANHADYREEWSS